MVVLSFSPPVPLYMLVEVMLKNPTRGAITPSGAPIAQAHCAEMVQSGNKQKPRSWALALSCLSDLRFWYRLKHVSIRIRLFHVCLFFVEYTMYSLNIQYTVVRFLRVACLLINISVLRVRCINQHPTRCQQQWSFCMAYECSNAICPQTTGCFRGQELKIQNSDLNWSTPPQVFRTFVLTFLKTITKWTKMSFMHQEPAGITMQSFGTKMGETSAVQTSYIDCGSHPKG